MENLTRDEEMFEFETLEDYGVDALGAAGTACSNNTSNGTEPEEPPVIIIT
jgi:hypothetical protein